jgi:hypothetical protein
MRTHTGVATHMFAALAGRGIDVALINTSEVRINVTVPLVRGREGQECLVRAFLQHASPKGGGEAVPGSGTDPPASPSDAMIGST